MNQFRQTIWLAGDRVLRALGQFLVIGAIARNLGVVEFGVFSWALALVGTAGLLSWAALDTALIRWWLGDSERALMRLSAVYRAQWALIGISAIAVFAVSTQHLPGQGIAVLLVFSLAAQSAEVLRFWNESRLTSDRYVQWDQLHFWMFVGLKLGASFTPFPLHAVVMSFALEGLTKAAFMAWMHREVLIAPPAPTREVQSFLCRHLPLFVAYLSGMAALKLPQLWLEQFVGPYETAYYAAAARMVEPLAFVPWAIISPLFVKLVAAKNHAERRSVHRQMLQWCLGSGLVLAIGLNILGPWGLQLIFGPEYAILSAPVLKKMAWMLVPQFALLVFVRQAIDSGKTTALAIQGLVQLLVLTLLLANATQASKGLTAETASMAALFSAVLSMVVLILYSIVSKKSR